MFAEYSNFSCDVTAPRSLLLPPPFLWLAHMREQRYAVYDITIFSCCQLLSCIVMVNFYSVFKRSNRSNHDKVSFYSIPKIITCQGEMMTELELTTARRTAWALACTNKTNKISRHPNTQGYVQTTLFQVSFFNTINTMQFNVSTYSVSVTSCKYDL